MGIEELVDPKIIAFLNKVVLVEDKTVKQEKPDPYIEALQRELCHLQTSIIPEDDLRYLGRSDIDDFFRVLKTYAEMTKTEGFLLYNPDYPDLVKVEVPDTFFKLNLGLIESDMMADEGIQVQTMPEFCEYLKKGKPKTELELAVLMKNETRPLSRFLYQTYICHLREGKMKIEREDRKRILDALDHLLPLCGGIQDNYELRLWKKLAKILHPGDYATEFPRAYGFLAGVRERSTKESHQDKPGKLHNLLWKAWKEGKENEALESYLSQETRVLDILETLRLYDLRPGISKFKVTCDRTLGTQEPGEEEKEIVEVVKLELRDKLIGSIKRKEEKRKIPTSWKELGAWEILCPHEEIQVPGSFRVRAGNSKTTILPRFSKSGVLRGNYMEDLVIDPEKYLEYEKILFFIIQRSPRSIRDLSKGIHQDTWVEDMEGNKIWKKRIDKEFSSMLAFIYTPSSRKLVWLGEKTGLIYSGSPEKISDLKKWERLWKKPDPGFLSLYDLARAMYIEDQENGEELEMEEILCELKD